MTNSIPHLDDTPPTEEELQLLNHKTFIGKRCKQCGSRVRYKRGIECVACARSISKDRRQRAKEGKPPSPRPRPQRPAKRPPRSKVKYTPQQFIHRSQLFTQLSFFVQKQKKGREMTEQNVRDMLLIKRELQPTKQFEVQHGNIKFRSVNHHLFDK